MSFTILLSVISILITAFLLYYNYARNYWSRKGIPGPPPELFFGNLRSLDNTKMLNVFQLQEWTKQYGKTYGVSEGAHKSLVTSDLDLLHDVFYRKFEQFHGRRLHPLTGDVDDPDNKTVHLFIARGARWKRLRTISNPTFNSVNLKTLHPIIQDSISAFLPHLEKVNGKEIDVFPYIREFTMDVISRIALGQEESQLFNNKNVESVKGFSEGRKISYPEYLAFMFPFLIKPIKLFVNFFQIRDAGFLQKMRDNSRQVVVKRRPQKLQTSNDIQFNDEERRKIDFIDLILDLDSELPADEKPNILDKQYLKTDKKFTIDEIVAMCQLFLISGYDATAVSIACLFYNLAIYPEVQKKIQDEIEQNQISDEPSFEEIQKLKYLHAVIQESLRVDPFAARACARQCMETTTVGNIKIDKGTQVVADVYTIHRSKEIWGPDADVFNPDRWLTDEKRHPMAWIPLGAGPRICIGMKLVYLEVKTLVICCLKKFDVMKSENTPEKLKLLGTSVVAPETVPIKFVLRE